MPRARLVPHSQVTKVTAEPGERSIRPENPKMMIATLWGQLPVLIAR
jgi:hypothetical protein